MKQEPKETPNEPAIEGETAPKEGEEEKTAEPEEEKTEEAETKPEE